MKKIFTLILFVFILTFFITVARAAEPEDSLKIAVEKLCTTLIKTDRDGFESMLSADQKGEMRWWWEASGKGQYFATLYGSCGFDHIDPKSTGQAQQKVFVQRFNKDGTKWSRPAPVVFQKDASGEWKIVNYSL